MAEKSFEDLIPERNERVHRRHRKEVFWQITFPLILGTLLLLSVCGLTIFAATGDVGVGIWRDISLIWMLGPSILFSLIPLALLAGLAYGVFRLIDVLPGVFYKIQNFLENVSARIMSVSNRMSAPIIRVGGMLAGLRKIKK